MKQITMILTNGFAPDVRVYKEALYLTKQGAHVTILCWDRESSLPENEEKDDIEIIRFKIRSLYGTGYKQLLRFFEYIKACRKYLKTHSCDYLHCHDLDGVIVGYIVRRNKTPMVFDMHEFYEKGSPTMRKIWRWLTIFLIKQTIATIYTNDSHLGDDYKAIRSKLYHLMNYPDSKIVEYKPKTESDVFRIGYHGVVRNQIAEFTALFEAVKGMDDVRVDINGGGIDLQQLKELEKKYSNVYVHGQYDGIKETTRLYADTDLLYCGYNRNDPFCQGCWTPIKYFEGILTGTPMLVSKGIMIGDKTEQNGFGLTCDTRNSDELRCAVIKLKNDKEFWSQCVEKERAEAHKYDWQEEVKVLSLLYV